jgi:putative endopeptidase
LKQTKIPAWLSEYGVSDEIEIENIKQFKEIFSKCNTKPPEVGEIPKDTKSHIGFFQTIWKTRNYRNEETFLKGIIFEILACKDISQFSFMLGSLCKSGIPVIMNINIMQERHKPFFLRKTIIPTNLTLLDSYYLNSKDNFNPIWDAYKEYIIKCALELNAPFLIHAIQAETELASILNINASEDDIEEFKGEHFIHWVPEFSWNEFMDGLGCSAHWRKEYWIIENSRCVKKLLQWFCHIEKEKIVALFILRLLNLYGKYLGPNIESAVFHFFSKTIRGITVKMPDELRLIKDISLALPHALCFEFSKLEYSISKFKQIEDLVERIKLAAIDTMLQNKLFNKHTTRRLVEKINRMKINIGTSKLEDIPKTPYFPESIIHTLMSIAASQNIESYRKSNHSIKRNKLTYPCFIVNASYYEESNQIIIPWGILHYPFFISKAPLGWNYGGIGATIAHEISHAFDLEGSKYDPRGHYKVWWSRKDRNNFKKRTRKMVKFFTKHQRFGRHLDGKKTLSENWADLGGLVIVLNALKKQLKEKGATQQEIKEAIKILFIGYSVSWRDKMRKKKVLYNLKESVHSLAEDRVDLIVPHFQEWVDAFDIKESDPLFIPVEERLNFF